MGRGDLSAEDFELLARIAHRYYEDGLTQEELAREFGAVAAEGPAPARSGPLVRRRGHPDRKPPLAPPRPRARAPGATSACARRSSPPTGRTPSRSARRSPAARRATSSAASRTAPSWPSATAATPARCRASSGPRRRIDCDVRERDGRLAARGLPDQPERDRAARLADRCGGRRWSLYAPAYVESGRDARPAPARSRPSPRPSRAAAAGVRRPRRDRRHGRRLHDGPQRLLLARGDRAACAAAGAVGDVLGNYVDVARPAPGVARRRRGSSASSIDDLRRDRRPSWPWSARPRSRSRSSACCAPGVVDVLVVDEGNAQPS